MSRIPRFFLAFLFVLPVLLPAQDCLPGGIEFTSQQEINDFPTEYPGCTRVLGDIVIDDFSAVFNLAPLAQIEYIGGDLIIENFQSLLDLNGLHNVDSIMGELRILDQIFPFETVEMESLKYAREIVIAGEEFVEVSFPALDSAWIIDLDLDNLSTMSVFALLRAVGSRLSIQCRDLDDLSGFSSLVGVDFLDVTRSDQLLDFAEMSALRSVRVLNVTNNDRLSSLAGLDNLDETLDNVSIGTNPQLSTCAISSICAFLETQSASIDNNAAGCNSEAEVDFICLTAGCPDPLSHNYNPMGLDSSSCLTCTDSIMNGDETGIDCGGELCAPCDCLDTIVVKNKLLANSKIYQAARRLEFDSVVFEEPYHYLLSAPEIELLENTIVEDGAEVIALYDSACVACDSFAWAQLGGDIEGEFELERFGLSIELNDSGNILVIGAPTFDDDGSVRGRVLCYEWNEGSWSQLGQTLFGVNDGAQFGRSVTINASGNRIAIGTPLGFNGRVEVYELHEDEWVPLGSPITNGQSQDWFGFDVQFDNSGNRIAISAPRNDEEGTNKGKASIYEWSSSSWIQVGNDIFGSQDSEEFGTSIDLSIDGKTLIAGAPNAVNNATETGALDVYQLDGEQWNLKGERIFGLMEGGNFGADVAIGNDAKTIIVGSDQHDFEGVNRGLAQVYTFEDSVWQQMGSNLYGESSGDWFGSSVCMNTDGTGFVAGSVFNDSVGFRAGQTRAFDYRQGSWTKLGESILPNSADERMGISVTSNISMTRIATGAIFSPSDTPNSGYVVVYEWKCVDE